MINKKHLLILALLFLLVLGLNISFGSYYFPGSSLDGQDVSWQKRTFEKSVQEDYSFKISSQELRRDFYVLEGAFISSYTRPEKEAFSLKPINFTSKRSLVYDKDKLKNELARVLDQLPEEAEARDASFSIKEGKLELIPQVIGYHFPSQEELYRLVEEKLANWEFELELDLYIEKPQVLTRDLRPDHNLWKNFEVRNSDYSWTLKGEELYSLFREDFSLDEDKARKTFEDYFSKADAGSTIWKVDIEESLPNFLEALENKNPSFDVSYARVRRSPSNHMNTGIMVSLDEQWLWVFSGGSEIFQAPIVSGNPNRGYPTHRGSWSILSKATNTRLANTNREGYSYDVPVSYWMQFNNEGMIEGFHDATWHWAFGTDVYLWDGSHGCVNLSVSDMATLYSISWVGMPVWVY